MGIGTEFNDDEAKKTLNDWKVCSICQIRLLQRNFDFEILKDSAFSETWTCYLCCGILQSNGISTEIVDQIISDIQNSKFEFDLFEINISTPPHLLIREFAIWYSIKTIFKDQYPTMTLDNITTVKAIWKWFIKNKVAEKLNKTYINGQAAKETRELTSTSTDGDILSVGVTFNHEKCDQECSVLGELEPSLFQRRRRGEKRYNWEVYTRKTVLQVLQRCTGETLSRYFRLPPHHQGDNTARATVAIIVSRPDPIVVGGRYRKLSRRLPQSPWIFDGVRRLDSSVEELICDRLVESARADSAVFMASGREDVDVRMLGKGRPFVVELRNCGSRTIDVRAIEDAINAGSVDRVVIERLTVVPRRSVDVVKCGEEERPKTYRAVVYCCERPLSEDGREIGAIGAMTEVALKQWTPVRVLHRRSLIERGRAVHGMRGEMLEDALSDEAVEADPSLADYRRFLDSHEKDRLMLLHLRCQAGTYIKEFVHGDLGRTQPNLGMLIGQTCDILALDVLDIELDWPPSQ